MSWQVSDYQVLKNIINSNGVDDDDNDDDYVQLNFKECM